VGFVTGIICSFIGTQIMGEFGPLVSFRIALGSGLAFLCAQLLDIAVFNRFRNGLWWKAPLISPVISSTLDTAIFFTFAFSAALTFLEPGNDVSWATAPSPLLGIGPEAPFWVSLALGDWMVKLLLAVFALMPFRLAIRQTCRTGSVNCFDKHKICVTLPLSATILKGGDPVSRVILERGVGTVGRRIF
jgi:uncharacterized integral membrane protein (TIGR00697 family)